MLCRSLDSVVSWRGSCSGTKCSFPFHYQITCKQRSDSPEMTLIATVWSPEGFAIAADGLEVLENPNGKRKEDVQKIFYTPFINETGFAWAWFGSVGFVCDSGNSFDFKQITECAVAELPDDAYLDDADSFFNRIARSIYIALPESTNLSRLPKTDDEVIFVGYLAGKPLWAEIAFPHTDEKFLPPTVKKLEYSPRDFNVFSGSTTIRDQMQGSGTLRQPIDILEAINSVSMYTKTCVESNRSVEDCRNFGGTVHIATVTKGGFAWIEKPKNLKK